MWIAPNMVTLLGFMFIVANVFLIEIFMPDMVGPVSAHYSHYEPAVTEALYIGSGVAILQLRVGRLDVSTAFYLIVQRSKS